MTYKILFCGTPEFARAQLETLLDDPRFEVPLVISQPDRPAGRGHKLQPSAVKTLALSRGVACLTPEKADDGEFIAELKKHDFDACVVVAYGQILRKNFLELFPGRCVNLHASLLPRWRGAAPIQRAIMSGDTRSGLCLQVVVPKLDAGPVIGERAIDISEEMNALELHDALAELGKELLKDDFILFLEGRKSPIPQDESLVTYAHKIGKEEALIDWNQDAKVIHDKVRGLAMGPHAATLFLGRRLKILKTALSDLSGAPGTVLTASDDTLTVACGAGSVELILVQPESKKAMGTAEFLRGYKLQKGDAFGTA